MTNTREKKQTSLFFIVYELNAFRIKTDIDRLLDFFPHRRLRWLGFLQTETYFTSSAYHTSDAGSRTGGQGHLTPSLTPPPSNPPPPHTHTHNNNCSIMNTHFCVQHERDRLIDGPTDDPKDRQNLLQNC